MKNVLKFRYLPVFAIVLAGGIAVAESAVKSSHTRQQLYAKVNGQWQSSALNPDQEGQPGGWQCNASTNICTGSFDSAPAPNAPDPDDAQSGTFVTIP